MSQPTHDPQLNALEAALAALQPAAARIDRDRILFAAGQRSVRAGWWWPVATAVSSLTALTLGVLLYLHSGSRVQYIQVPAPAATSSHSPEMAHQPSVSSPPAAAKAQPWQEDWESPREKLLEQATAAANKPLPSRPVSTAPLSQWLGWSGEEWKECHFLGKPTGTIFMGGF
jgi:hypothetical protein